MAEGVTQDPSLIKCHCQCMSAIQITVVFCIKLMTTLLTNDPLQYTIEV